MNEMVECVESKAWSIDLLKLYLAHRIYQFYVLYGKRHFR